MKGVANQEVKTEVRSHLGTENQGYFDTPPSSPLWIIYEGICY